MPLTTIEALLHSLKPTEGSKATIFTDCQLIVWKTNAIIVSESYKDVKYRVYNIFNSCGEYIGYIDNRYSSFNLTLENDPECGSFIGSQELYDIAKVIEMLSKS